MPDHWRSLLLFIQGERERERERGREGGEGGRERGSCKLQLKLSALGCTPARNLVSWLQDSHQPVDFVNTTGHLNRQQNPPDISPDSHAVSPTADGFSLISSIFHPLSPTFPKFLDTFLQQSHHTSARQRVTVFAHSSNNRRFRCDCSSAKCSPSAGGAPLGVTNGHKRSVPASPEKAAADNGRLHGYTHYTLKIGPGWSLMITLLVTSFFMFLLRHVPGWISGVSSYVIAMSSIASMYRVDGACHKSIPLAVGHLIFCWVRWYDLYTRRIATLPCLSRPQGWWPYFKKSRACSVSGGYVGGFHLQNTSTKARPYNQTCQTVSCLDTTWNTLWSLSENQLQD